jgi:hypothetical protein
MGGRIVVKARTKIVKYQFNFSCKGLGCFLDLSKLISFYFSATTKAMA